VTSSSSVLPDAAPGEPPTCPSCGNTYNFTGRRPRVLSCLHSVCEECLQILFDSCPRYKFTCCPTCRCETVLFTDYGLAALAVDYSILSRLPVKEESLAPSSTVDCEGEEKHSSHQSDTERSTRLGQVIQYYSYLHLFTWLMLFSKVTYSVKVTIIDSFIQLGNFNGAI
uniref:Ring finger protein 208 n=1 Tax=Scleropages formosus TaxID=113540 RepID=A0A8C9VTW0_SCLFO